MLDSEELMLPLQALRLPSLERSYWCAGLLLNFLVEHADTDGAYTLIDGVVRQDVEPPPHTHTVEDEELLVLAGTLFYRYGSVSGRLEPGETVLLPRGIEHSFRSLTLEVRLLVKLSPGGLEASFKAFGTAVADSLLPPPLERVPTFSEIAHIFAEAGVFFRPNSR